jgi:hypothetical protein
MNWTEVKYRAKKKSAVCFLCRAILEWNQEEKEQREHPLFIQRSTRTKMELFHTEAERRFYAGGQLFE